MAPSSPSSSAFSEPDLKDVGALSILAFIGADIKIASDIKTAKDIIARDGSLVELCYAVLEKTRARNVYERLPRHLPRDDDPSQRFKVAQMYARVLNALGAKVSFGHFLYPGIDETREILEFLSSILPDDLVRNNVASDDDHDRDRLRNRGKNRMVERARRAANEAWNRTPSESRARRLLGGRKSADDDDGKENENKYNKKERVEYVWELVNKRARNVAKAQMMRDIEAFKLQKEWNEGLWPEGPHDDKLGASVIVPTSAGVGGLVAASIRASGGMRLKEDVDDDAGRIMFDKNDVNEMFGSMNLGEKVKLEADAKRNREESANDKLEQRAIEREKDLENLQNEVDNARKTMHSYVIACEKAVSDMIEYARLEKEELLQFPDLEEDYFIRKMATDMVIGPNASTPEKAREELEKLVREDENRRELLHKEWDENRIPLENEIENRTRKAEDERKRAKEQLEEIQAWKDEARGQVQIARAKAEERERLAKALERAPKGVDRPSLVLKVTTIVKNLKKQELEIAKIVRDAKEAELQIADGAESLRKIYALVEDAVFKEAKADETMKMAYRYLHDMHKNFAKISRDVAEASESARARGELEKQMDSLKELNTDSTKVAKDVRTLTKTVKELEARISTNNK